MKTLRRIVVLVLAAAFFVELTAIYADFQPHSPHLRFEVERPRRSPTPQFNRLPSFLGQFAVVGLIALAGRKILGLRLSTSRSDSL
ncbi:MAG: hypothetical protein WDO73_08935 [Ignavibacteriota bacterium]